MKEHAACLQLKLSVLRVATPVQFARAATEVYPCCVDVLSLLKYAAQTIFAASFAQAQGSFAAI